MPRSKSTELSSTQERVLRALLHTSEHGVATVKDLVTELGLAGDTSLAPTLQIMARNGYVTINGGGRQGSRRLISLTPKGKSALGANGVCVLGEIPAGPLSEALEECSDFIDLGDALQYEPGDFMLTVKGDSMIGDGILSGDKVLLRPSVQTSNGEVAAVYVGDDYKVTLKRVFSDVKNKKIVLKASNPKYPDIILEEADVRIAGVFRGLIRSG